MREMLLKSVPTDPRPAFRRDEAVNTRRVRGVNDQVGVTTRKCQNCPVRENQTWTILGLEREIAPIERVKDTAGASGRRSKVKSVRLIV